MNINSKIKKLENKALSQGQYALAAAASHALLDIHDVNRQINLVGALHEVGYLQNSIAPYWNEWRSNEEMWLTTCISRLILSDYDYWALASILCSDGHEAINTAKKLGFKSAALRSYIRYDEPNVHVNTLYINASGNILYPLLEIGYDSEDFSIVDVGRARALMLKNDKWKEGEFIGNGDLAISMQAKLPHGSWRTVSTEFEMKKSWLTTEPDSTDK